MIGQLLINALIAGSLYALAAEGLLLIYGQAKFINFSHGAVAVLAAFEVWFLVSSAGF